MPPMLTRLDVEVTRLGPCQFDSMLHPTRDGGFSRLTQRVEFGDLVSRVVRSEMVIMPTHKKKVVVTLDDAHADRP